MVKILVTGDFCPINRIEALSVDGKHAEIFNDFLPLSKEADIAITNLECPLYDGTGKAAKFGPALKSSVKTVESLKYSGFGVVTMANNHIMDFGDAGLQSTVKVLDENGISHFGTGNTLDEARKPLIKEVNGIKIAFLNFAENEFSNTHGNAPGANPLALASNFNDIKNARTLADKVIIIVHGGNETFNLPSPRFKETLRFFADCGADAVLAHHTHCVSGYEVYNGVPVFYGLGNFVFDHLRNKNTEWTRGIAVELLVEDKAIGFNIYPFHQNNGEAGVRMYNEQEKKAFMAHLESLNAIIADDVKLEAEFQKFIAKKSSQYNHFMEPYDSKVLHGLFSRKIIPSFYSEKKKRLLLNLIRCESHRDVVINLLSK